MYCPNCGSEITGTSCPICASVPGNPGAPQTGVGRDAQTRLVLSGWWRRVGATVIDILIFVGVALLLSTIMAVWLASLFEAAGYAAYLIILLASENGQTIGNRVAGTRVRTASAGGVLTLQQSVIRWAVIGVPSLLVSIPTLRGLSFLAMIFVTVDSLFPLWDARNQTIHDHLAGTIVVHANAPI